MAVTRNQPAFPIDTQPAEILPCWPRHFYSVALLMLSSPLPIWPTRTTALVFWLSSLPVRVAYIAQLTLADFSLLAEEVDSLLSAPFYTEVPRLWVSVIQHLLIFFSDERFFVHTHSTAAKSSKIESSAKISTICLFWRCRLPCHSPSLLTGFIQFTFFGKNKYNVLGTSTGLRQRQNGHAKRKKIVRNTATQLIISEMCFKEVNSIFRLNSFHFVSPKALDSRHKLTGFHLTSDVILCATDIIV